MLNLYESHFTLEYERRLSPNLPPFGSHVMALGWFSWCTLSNLSTEQCNVRGKRIKKKKFQKALQNPRITFDCRINDNGHNANVLEDFFSMMDFDCLIRPGSHFSRFVQRLGNNKVVIYPESVRKTIGGKSVINVINMKTRAEVTDRWKTKKITIA